MLLQVATEFQPSDIHGVDILVHQKLAQFIDYLLIRPDIVGVKKRHQSLGISAFLLILFSFFHKSNNSKQNEKKDKSRCRSNEARVTKEPLLQHVTPQVPQ